MSQSRQGHRRFAVAVLLGAGLMFGRAALADTEDGARKHAAKANRLAAKNKCKAAIFEFTRALKTLKDPSLLFNRAECFRKVGRTDEAITDYEQFLLELPSTPNRAAVEERIAALKATATPRPVPGASQPAPPEPSKTKPPAPPLLVAPASPSSPPAAAAPAPPRNPPAAPVAAPAPKPEEPAGAPARKAEKWVD